MILARAANRAKPRPGGAFLVLSFILAVGCTSAPADGDVRQNEMASPPTTSAILPAVEAGGTAEASVQMSAKAQTDAEEIRSEFWIAAEPVQGAVILGRAPGNVKNLLFDGQLLPVASDGFFLIGFNRDAPARATLLAGLNDGSKVEKILTVKPGDWKIEHVNVSRSRSGKASAAFARRRKPELAQINAARRQNNDSIGWRQDFIWPIKGRISGYFGFQRFYRGVPGGYHTGMDIAGKTPSGRRVSNHGKPFVAPADGVVTLAAHSPFSLEGKLLMLDHGMGLNSAFLHCSEILVNVGDVVKQGQVIGRVGSTGSATGPHLHWGMKWNKARVDPKLLVPAL